MASPHPNYITPSKTHATTSHGHQLQKNPPKPLHKPPSRRIHSAAAATSAVNPGSICSSTSTSSSSSAPSQNSVFCPFYSSPQTGLGPEFRRARSTKVISKRNFNSPRHGHDNASRSGSDAAARCLNEILSGRPDDRSAIAAALSNFRPSLAVPEDYCFVLHELGNGDKCPPRAVAFFDNALPAMRSYVEKGKLLTAAIGVLGKMGRPDVAKKLFDAGVVNKYGDTVFAHSAMISAYARSGLAVEAMAVLDSLRARGLKPTTISYNAVIDACGKGGVDIQLTIGFFRDMLCDGLRPDRKTFNSLIAACSRAGHLDEARAVFDEMIHRGIGRDIYTYNTFIDAVCKCGDMNLAMQVVLDMDASNVKPNVVTYSTLMDGYSKLERFDEALKLYEKMKSLCIPLDRVCYNTLLSIYVKTGKYEDIAKVCEEMDATGVDKDTVTYNSLIHGYGKQGRFDIVAYLIQDMRTRGVAASVLTYSTLMDIYSKAGMYGNAANVFLEFKESGLKADVVLYSSFIDTLAKNGLVANAVWLLDEMVKMGIKPNVVTYNTIIDAFGKSRGYFEEDDDGNNTQIVGLYSAQIVGAVSQTGGSPDLAMREDSSRRSQELLCILDLFQKMIQQGVRPNVVTFSAILNACSRCNSFEDASLLLEQLRLFDNFVYGVAHGLLMGYQEAWLGAEMLFNELKRMDSPTSSAFYNALTDVLWHFGQRQGAQRVVLEGVYRQVWENSWSEFSLDLHLMSTGAAQAMVHAWLANVHSIVFSGRALPEFVSILTGWGRHSKVVGASTLRRVIEALLRSIGAPFQLERFNMGRFVSPSTMMAAWLRDSQTQDILILRDERLRASNPHNLIPRLQALQL